MSLKKTLVTVLCCFSLNILSQSFIDFKKDIQYSDTLKIELLKKVCSHLNIQFSRVYINKSQSLSFNNTITFFAIQYIIKNTEEGNLYTTKYLFVKTENGAVIDEVDDINSFFDTEALQLSSSYILKKKVKLNNSLKGVCVVSEIALKSCATLYTEKKMMVIALIDNKISKLLNNYTIRKTNGESNCNGVYQIETLEKSIAFSSVKTKGLFDLCITKIFNYQDIKEENLKEGNKGKNIHKNKIEFEKLVFNGKKYDFKKDENYRFLDW